MLIALAYRVRVTQAEPPEFDAAVNIVSTLLLPSTLLEIRGVTLFSANNSKLQQTAANNSKQQQTTANHSKPQQTKQQTTANYSKPQQTTANPKNINFFN